MINSLRHFFHITHVISLIIERMRVTRLGIRHSLQNQALSPLSGLSMIPCVCLLDISDFANVTRDFTVQKTNGISNIVVHRKVYVLVQVSRSAAYMNLTIVLSVSSYLSQLTLLLYCCAIMILFLSGYR